ncbi:MAG TPA: carbamoyltransferase C-terminal domain-containing protein [Vicinamibacterales bacterium]|nr:carbamoyltransferase C-terminal domain-containing protein [Vicinamibacterales bacterium]
MAVIIGLAGASRNGAVAVCDEGRMIGMCEHERVTRTRREPLPAGKLPAQTVATILRGGPYEASEIAVCAVAERAITLSSEFPVEYVDHHRAHAATAFYTSPFAEATILVCDRGGDPEVTVWLGDERGVRRADFDWRGRGLATIYSRVSEAMGFGPDGEAKVEALARIGAVDFDSDVPAVVYRGDSLEVPAQFQTAIADAADRSAVAARVQRQLGDVLLELVGTIREQVGGTNLCLAGGLFYNSFFNTALARSNLFAHTFVPANPGNAGVAIGAALMASPGPVRRDTSLTSPFLGPGFSAEEVKATLDNCKLSYDYLSNGRLLEQTTAALVKGELVGWFQGRMEWGVRALGHRSILASPTAPYVLENLNRFLKHRDRHRTYAVAVCAEDASRFFCGPPASPLMEYEYDVLDRVLFRHLLPENATKLRVQTVDASAGSFYELLRAFGDLTGVPVLVNTSFNGFNEPIVCHPRDAVRVFYGTGLDMAVLDGLVLRK